MPLWKWRATSWHEATIKLMSGSLVLRRGVGTQMLMVSSSSTAEKSVVARSFPDATSGTSVELDRKSAVSGVTGVQTCALPICLAQGSGNADVDGVELQHGGQIRGGAQFSGCHQRDQRGTRSEERRVGSDWSSDVCSSDLSCAGEWERRC